MKKSYSVISIGDSSATGSIDKVNPFNHIILKDTNKLSNQDKPVSQDLASHQLQDMASHQLQDLASHQLQELQSGEPPSPQSGKLSSLKEGKVANFISLECGDDREDKPDNHWHFSTLPR